jgi:hypothetical protein
MRGGELNAQARQGASRKEKRDSYNAYVYVSYGVVEKTGGTNKMYRRQNQLTQPYSGEVHALVCAETTRRSERPRMPEGIKADRALTPTQFYVADPCTWSK